MSDLEAQPFTVLQHAEIAYLLHAELAGYTREDQGQSREAVQQVAGSMRGLFCTDPGFDPERFDNIVTHGVPQPGKAMTFTDLITVVEIDTGADSWGFDLFAVFYDRAGKAYYTGTDSGCSCPSPWDGKALEELDGPFTFREALAQFDNAMTTAEDTSGAFVDSAYSARNRFREHAKENGIYPE